MFFLSSASLRVCQVLISALTGERDEASLTHPLWGKNPDVPLFFFNPPVRQESSEQGKKKKKDKNKSRDPKIK